MKTKLKMLFATTAIILPISSFAADEKPMQPSDKPIGMMQNCPQAERMDTLQKDMDKMAQEMQSMMSKTKDKEMKERMQEMHGQMKNVMKTMQEMHQNMGMGKGRMKGQDNY